MKSGYEQRNALLVYVIIKDIRKISIFLNCCFSKYRYSYCTKMQIAWQYQFCSMGQDVKFIKKDIYFP